MTHKKIIRFFRRNPLSRCGICGKKPTDHDLTIHKEKVRV